jgi:hypothetical protein
MFPLIINVDKKVKALDGTRTGGWNNGRPKPSDANNHFYRIRHNIFSFELYLSKKIKVHSLLFAFV